VFALDAAYYEKDLDCIFYTVSLLKGRAANWYEGEYILIHKDTAQVVGVPWDPNSEWFTSSHVRNALSETIGISLTTEMAIAEWESVTHKLSKIDEYLDRIGQLGFLTKYNHDVVKNKVIAGLYKDLRIE
jgi:hypothetical protein